MNKLAPHVEVYPTCGKKNSNFKKIDKPKKLGRILSSLDQGRKQTMFKNEPTKSDLNKMLAEAVKNTK